MATSSSIADLKGDATDSIPWQIERLRLTFFTTDSQADHLDAHDLWKTAFPDNAPERSTCDRKKLLATASGAFEGSGTIQAGVKPDRFDWVWFRESPDPVFDVVGSFPRDMEPFRALMARWLSTAPSAKRIAFGAALLCPAQDHRDSVRQLSRLLPSLHLEGDETDVFLQINRKRPSCSGLDGLAINRLMKWSIATVAGVMAIMDTSGPRPIAAHEPLFAARLELDINTTASFPAPIDREYFGAIFDELIEMGIEISARGDIP